MVYYIVFGGLYLVSLLPLWILYRFSDVFAALLYFVIRYRRRVVFENLLIAFPEKTDAERRRIARKFYRNFTDNFIETIKLMSASRAWIQRHFVCDNPDMVERFYHEGRRGQLHLGHNFNWELANVGMATYTKYKFIVVYMPIENKALNRVFLYLRARTGTVLLSATRMQREILPYRNEQYLLTLVGDQAPPFGDNAYWLNFFGRPTPFIRGPERGARAGDIPDLFVRFYKNRRGHYRIEFTVISDHPARMTEGQLTLKYARLLEDAIRRDPDLWLWSHKRWKHPWKTEYAAQWVDEGQAGGGMIGGDPARGSATGGGMGKQNPTSAGTGRTAVGTNGGPRQD